MKEPILAFANYNQRANAKLVEILKAQPEVPLREDQGAFYKSVLGTLEHIFSAELMWLKRYQGFFSLTSLGSSPLLAADSAATKEKAAKGTAELYTLLAEADALFVAFVQELDEKRLSDQIAFKNTKGVDFQRAAWITLFQILNHSTHHRGEVSVLLDRKGIANDYSNFYAGAIG